MSFLHRPDGILLIGENIGKHCGDDLNLPLEPIIVVGHSILLVGTGVLDGPSAKSDPGWKMIAHLLFWDLVSSVQQNKPDGIDGKIGKHVRQPGGVDAAQLFVKPVEDQTAHKQPC